MAPGACRSRTDTTMKQHLDQPLSLIRVVAPC